MAPNPRVSVVMPAFNAERYLAEAIESILGQTFGDFEFIIINDGSTDGTAEILESWRAADPRIRVRTQDNLGVATSMNVGCELARGDYIARMDADDISLPERLGKQVEFLDKHPNIRVCGTWMRTFGDSSHSLCRYPQDPQIAQSTLHFQLPVIGPAVMFEKTLYSGRGVRRNSNVGAADDYLFIVECSKYTGISSIPEVLYLYRQHATQITKTHRSQQHQFAKQIRLQQLEELGMQPTEDEINVHEKICTWQMEGDQSSVEKIEDWLAKLKLTNVGKQKYPQEAFALVLWEYWFAACTRNSHLGLWAYRKLYNSALSADMNLEIGRKLKLLAKCTMYRPAQSTHLLRGFSHRN